MATMVDAERMPLNDYVIEVRALSRRLRESMVRVGEMFPDIEARLDDPAWRATVIAEARSWRWFPQLV